MTIATPAAVRPRRSLRRRLAICFAVLMALGAIAGAGVLGYYATRPGAMDYVTDSKVALGAYPGRPTGASSEFARADLVTRGRYLTDAADCQACHTVKGGTPYAGGRPFKTPFGTLYSPNITPDPETGIGRWTDAELIKAVHKGVGRGGKPLYPAFPYAAYTAMPDDDVRAIRAYLFSLAPVRAPTPANRLAFPFNQRRLMTIWGALFNPDRRFEPVPARSSAWNRGAYLVENVAHCGECHTPRNLMQALDNSRKFAGANTGGWRAYDITSDQASGIGEWSDADLVNYLSTGHAAGRGTASGPMGEAVELSLSKLSPSDLAAIVTYLRRVPIIEGKEQPSARTASAPFDPLKGEPAGIDPRGRRIFAGACAGCHAWTGSSPLSTRAVLTGTRAINDPTATNVAQIIIHGSEGKRRAGVLAMPAFGARYSDAEIAAVANYVTARFGAAPSDLTPEAVGKLRKAD